MDNPASTSRPAPRIHLSYLDGIRGLAALFVVFHHVWQRSLSVYHGERLPFWFHAATIFKFGHYAVDVFIVLSGFCLMLPVTKSSDGVLPSGMATFFKRRARRILPPYFAAVALSLSMLALIPALKREGMGVFSMYDPHGMRGAVISHLFLVHNLSHAWAYRIDDPLWSVATEWQIYFVFPLLLLPIWRRFGAAASIVVGYAAGILLTRAGFGEACFWYIGLFAMGMAGACAAAKDPKQENVERRSWNGALALLGWLASAVAIAYVSKHGDRLTPAADFVVGLATMWLLVYCAREGRDGKLARAFSHRWAVGLGVFSYSLYLIHFPLLAWMQSITAARGLSTARDFVILSLVGVPAVVVLSYIFHLVFERRFMNSLPSVTAVESGLSRRGWRWSNRASASIPATADRDAAVP